MKKKLAILIVVFIVFGLYFCVVYVFSKYNDEIDSKNHNTSPVESDIKKQTIVLNNNKVFNYINGDWDEGSEEDYLGLFLNVYDGNEYIGQKEIMFNNKWYINDKNSNFYELKDYLFAYQGDYDVKVNSVFFRNLDDVDYNLINEYLYNKNLLFSIDNLFVSKYLININNVSGHILSIVNAESLDSPLIGDKFSFLIFINQNNTIEEINAFVGKNSIDCEFNLQNSILMNSKKFIIFECIYPSMMGTTNYIYEFNNGFELRYHTQLD